MIGPFFRPPGALCATLFMFYQVLRHVARRSPQKRGLAKYLAVLRLLPHLQRISYERGRRGGIFHLPMREHKLCWQGLFRGRKSAPPLQWCIRISGNRTQTDRFPSSPPPASPFIVISPGLAKAKVKVRALVGGVELKGRKDRPHFSIYPYFPSAAT